MSRRRLALLLAAVVTATAAPAALAAAPANDAAYDATIRTTAYGIPHISGKDFADVGYGYGYSLAGSTICVMADTYTTVRAQRSRFFGEAESYVFRGNGATVNNLNSDFFFQQVIDDERVEKLMNQPAPNGPKPELRELVTGYVAGYNRWLKDVGGAKGITDPACAGKPWVTEITELDAYRRFYQLALLASSGVALDGIGGAQPPTPSAPLPSTSVDSEQAARLLDERWEQLAIGSNAVALGKDATENGRGMLLGNPHFPWIGSERFYQAQLTVPGKMNVTGGSLLGVPLVLIGHTATMAWSHTVSTAFRFTPFQLTLVPGSPTTYLYDGQPRQMTSREVTVTLKDGSTQSRTLWSSHQGPILTSILGLPIFPWTPGTAWALGDANAPNFRYLNHFLEVDQATSAKEVLEILKRNQGIPWVNTIAADDKGDALYADISVTPNVTDEKAQVCNTAMGQATFAYLRLPVLDGSRSACEWGVDEDAVQPGTFGPSNMPYLLRSDYVTNSNDSFWLSQPRQPLTGFARIIGDEETARTLRTRSGLVMVEEELADNGRFTRQELQDLLYSDRQHAGELTRDDVVAMCESFPGGFAPSASGPVAVGDSCAVLAAWDLTDALDARGALLFRRFWTRAAGASGGTGAGLWRTPFSTSDPVNTPRDLNTANPQVMQAFGDALNDLSGAGIPVDAPLGDFQKDQRPDGTTTSYHGGPGPLGVFNAMSAPWNPSKGYVGRLAHGSSFIQTVSFDGDGCPDTRTILTYSQSTNPKSPHYADQTELYRDGGWVKGVFCEADVKKATLSTQRLRSVGGAVGSVGVLGAAAPGLPATGLPVAVSALAVVALLGAVALRRQFR